MGVVAVVLVAVRSPTRIVAGTTSSDWHLVYRSLSSHVALLASLTSFSTLGASCTTFTIHGHLCRKLTYPTQDTSVKASSLYPLRANAQKSPASVKPLSSIAFISSFGRVFCTWYSDRLQGDSIHLHLQQTELPSAQTCVPCVKTGRVFQTLGSGCSKRRAQFLGRRPRCSRG